jgi:hypothetical protein
METIHIIIIIALLIIFFRINKESYNSCSVYSQRINSELNPSKGIQDILQYTQSEQVKCIQPDWTTASPKDFSNYATCLNKQKLLTTKLAGAFGSSSPN